MSETRKIAAILVTDIVGYSRLAGADEDRILARLRALRSDLIDPTIALHHGRVVKRTGDGSLIEFRSVVDAVRCAIEVQNGMVERNAGLPPERRIEFRVGIHLGDVVEESDGDLMGDGVNIAARLEGVCEPGAICLSEDAYRQVSGRLDMAVADLGPTQLKNIERLIRVYSLQVGVPAQAKPAMAKPEPKHRWRLALLSAGIAALIPIAAGAWHFLSANRSALVAAPSIAVLPFDNLAGDEQANRLADGMTEDIITDLAHYKDLLVIARNSTTPYKGKAVDARQVAKDLDVRYVLAGSIQHQGDQLRVTAELIDAATGTQLWSERWDRPAQDMFAVQAELADKVAAALGGNGGSNSGAIKGRLLAEAKQRASANLSAYDLWLLAREQMRLRNKTANPKGFEYVDKAIALDPNFAPAYATRAWLKMEKYWIFGTPSWATQIKEFESDLRQALALDPSLYSAHAGLIRYFADTGQWTELSAEIDRAVRDNPTNIVVLASAAENLPVAGRPEEGVAMADLALRLDPQMPRSTLRSLIIAYFFSHKFERAIGLSDQIPEENRDFWPRFVLAASYAFLGRAEEAERAKADLIAKDGEQVLEMWFNEGDALARTSERDLEREGFRKLGLRICATDEELKKYDNPKRLPECVKT